MKKIKISEAVKSLLDIVQKLNVSYPKKKFTLDGRLVGDLGEILVEEFYDVLLYENIKAEYDGETSDNKKVQIKTTMLDSLTFPANHIPEYYIGIKIASNGSLEEIYNGPGKYIFELVKNRSIPKNQLHILPIKKLKEISEKIKEEDRIKRKEKRF